MTDSRTDSALQIGSLSVSATESSIASGFVKTTQTETDSEIGSGFGIERQTGSGSATGSALTSERRWGRRIEMQTVSPKVKRIACVTGSVSLLGSASDCC